MPAGLLVINDTGSVQLDENFYTFALVAQGVETTIAKTTQGGNSKLFISLAGMTNPIIAIQPVDKTGLMYANAGGAEFVTDSPVGTDIPYWVFDSELPVETEDAGMQVFNATGDLVYTSSQKQLRVHSLVGGVGVVALPAGREYALAYQTSFGHRTWAQGTHPSDEVDDWWEESYVISAVFSDVDEITFDEIEHSWSGPFEHGDPGIPGTDLNFPGQIMVIDVTDY